MLTVLVKIQYVVEFGESMRMRWFCVAGICLVDLHHLPHFLIQVTVHELSLILCLVGRSTSQNKLINNLHNCDMQNNKRIFIVHELLYRFLKSV